MVERKKSRTPENPAPRALRSTARNPKKAAKACAGDESERDAPITVAMGFPVSIEFEAGSAISVAPGAVLDGNVSPAGRREYWEQFEIEPDELERLGYSDEPVAGLQGVRPAHPANARQILESFVQCVREGERIPWAIVRFLAYAFDGIASAGLDADGVASDRLGLRYRHSSGKREDRLLGRNMNIGLYVLNAVRAGAKAGQRGRVTAAVESAAQKFGVDEGTARDQYRMVRQMLRRNGIPELSTIPASNKRRRN